MRIFRPHSVRLARALIVASIVIAAGCGGGGSSNSNLPNPGFTGICDPNAGSISLARTPGGGGNTIEIVSSTDQDQLHGAPNQFDLNLRDNFGNVIITNPLTLVPDNSGPHPYTNDFYYSATLQSPVQPGLTYTVFLNAPNTACQPGVIGSFST